MGTMHGPLGPGMMKNMGMYRMDQPRIEMQDVPIMNTLNSRPLPPFPMQWREQEFLMPGQRTGMGMDNISPLQERAVEDLARLPHAYRMYGYGPREIVWSGQVPTPEHQQNTG